MSMRFAIVCGLVAALLVPSAHAQDQAGLWRSFAEKLPPGAFVIVHLANGSTVKGQLVQVTPDAVSVLPKTRLPVPARSLAIADIESMETRKEGMSPGAKVLIGVGSVGAAMLLLFVAAVASGGWD
jgi:hypothetical protein